MRTGIFTVFLGPFALAAHAQPMMRERTFRSRSGGILMSTEWFLTPLDLVKNTLTISGTYSGVGHGTPGTLPMLQLDFVPGGGGACLPE